MSRCFPYPPPGYVRNPVAAAEAEATTKLQKAEKKKEKRNDKKALQQGGETSKHSKALQQGGETSKHSKALQQGGETSKHSKRTHKKRKHEESKKASKESVEQLEKSGLSEEHGAPCFIQTVHDSPESSQDSSKRRKVVLPSPCQNKNGNVLRIKIKRDQDSQTALLEKPRVLEQLPVQQMGSGSSLLSKQNTIQPRHNKAMLKSAAAMQQSIKGDPQAVPKHVGTQPVARIMQRVDPQTTGKGIQKIDPQLSVKAATGRVDPPPAKMMRSVDPSPAKVMGRTDPPPAKATRRVDPPPAKVLQRVDPPLSSKVIQRDAPPSCSKVLQKETNTAAFRQPQLEQPPLIQKPKLLVDSPVNKQQQTNASLPKEEPCFSGRKTEAAPVPEVKQSKSDRKKSRRAEKKEKKLRDLFVTWNSPSFEVEDTDVGDQDWLLGSTNKPDAIMVDCRASDGSLPFQSVEQQFSLQPRAIHLPDLHIYQLPYVVPF